MIVHHPGAVVYDVLQPAGKQGIPYLAVIGDDELTSGEVKVKCMADGTETAVKFDGLTDYLASR